MGQLHLVTNGASNDWPSSPNPSHNAICSASAYLGAVSLPGQIPPTPPIDTSPGKKVHLGRCTPDPGRRAGGGWLKGTSSSIHVCRCGRVVRDISR